MKRTELKRRSGLSRGKPLQAAPPGRRKLAGSRPKRTLSTKTRVAKRLLRLLEPGEASWKRKRNGYCQVCGAYGPIVLHHITREQDVRRAASKEQVTEGIVWDQRNALRVGAPTPWGGRCRCHDRHSTPGIRDDDRISYEKIPQMARRYAREILGEDHAVDYFRRYYRDAP